MKKNSEKGEYNNFLKNIFSYKKSGYIKYFHEVGGNKLYYAFSASVLMTFLDSIGIGFILALLQNIFIPAESTGNSILQKINMLFFYFGFSNLNNSTLLILVLLMFLIKGLISYAQLYLQASINSTILSETRRQIVQDVSNLRFENFISTDLGTIQNISTTEISRLNTAMTNYLNTIQFSIMSFCYIIIAVYSNLFFSFIVLLNAAIILYFYNFIVIYFKKLSAQVSKKGNLYNSYMLQLLNNYKYLKTTNGIAEYQRKIIEEINSQERISLKFAKITALTISAREPLTILIVGLVIVIYYQISGDINTIIIFSLFLFYRTLNYILMAQSNWQNFQQFAGSMHNITRTKTLLKKATEPIGNNVYEGLKKDIKLVNVEVKINGNIILNQINLTLPKNSTTAIIGKSGAGKSTLASLICGLIPPNKGSLLIDGNELKNYNILEYRNSIGYVSQDAVIFNDSIYNNITLWGEKSELNIRNFHRTIRLSELDELLEQYPEKEDTILGDNGIILSGGQKQRISIARELFKNTEIIIMDEATSSLDSTTEHLVKTNINLLTGNSTMIIIAHRLSTIQSVENILLMDAGKILISGNYDYLIQNSQLFKEMISLQNMSDGFI